LPLTWEAVGHRSANDSLPDWGRKYIGIILSPQGEWGASASSAVLALTPLAMQPLELTTVKRHEMRFAQLGKAFILPIQYPIPSVVVAV
jgi:hypothetical protein